MNPKVDAFLSKAKKIVCLATLIIANLESACRARFVILRGPLRIFATSALKGPLNAENAEIRRGPQRITT